MRFATSILSLCSLLSFVACSDDGVPADGGTGSADGSSTATGPETSAGTTGTGTSTTQGSTTTEGPGTQDGSGDSTAASDATGATETAGGTDTASSGTGSTGESGSSGSTSSTDGGSSGSDTGVTMPGSSCVSDNDCVVIDDCCTCEGAHEDDDVPVCGIDCDTPLCTANDVGNNAECVFGTCQIEETTCNEGLVLCDSLPPDCPDGWLPSVDGDCWSNECVPAEACDFVPDCSWCAAYETCVDWVTQLGQWSSCEPIAPECMGEPTCACMPGACEAPYDTCGDGPNGLSCSCPAC